MKKANYRAAGLVAAGALVAVASITTAGTASAVQSVPGAGYCGPLIIGEKEAHVDCTAYANGRGLGVKIDLNCKPASRDVFEFKIIQPGNSSQVSKKCELWGKIASANLTLYGN